MKYYIFFSLFDSIILLFFSTTDHKRRVQQWSYKQNCLLLSYSAHLKIDVHCSSKVKKKKYFFITLLSPLSLKKHFLFSFSLSLSGFSSFIFLPQFFVLSSLPASSLIADLFRRPSLPTHPKPHRPILHLIANPGSIANLSFIIDPSSTDESNNACAVTWDREYVSDTDLNGSMSKVATQCGVRGGDNGGRG